MSGTNVVMRFVAGMAFLVAVAGCGASGQEGPTSCSTHVDCAVAKGELCRDGFCIIPQSCQTNDECPIGQTCNALFYCQPYGEVPISTCPAARVCNSNLQCAGLGYVLPACVDFCCEDLKTGGDTDKDADVADGLDPDIAEGDPNCTVTGCPTHYACSSVTFTCVIGSDHCVNSGCNDPFVCNDSSGDCVPGAAHCSTTGCSAALTVCNTLTGACMPGPDHCTTTGCPQKYACLASKGTCGPGDDHCNSTGCGDLYTCNRDSGFCIPASGNCVVEGCPTLYDCNENAGTCAPSAAHCLTTGCATLYSCNQTSGVCEATADHCSRKGCAAHFACDTPSGNCNPDATHCATTGCGAMQVCANDTGACAPSNAHCAKSGCGEKFACNQTSGLCEKTSGHCSNTGCSTSGYQCDVATGLCKPDGSVTGACVGSCSGDTASYCFSGGAFLCDCEGKSYRYVECDVKCRNDGYPGVDDCSAACTDSNKNSYNCCNCAQYDYWADGTCANPVIITGNPYVHSWDVLFSFIIGDNSMLSSQGCTPLGAAPTANTAKDHVYRIDAVAGEKLRIVASTEILNLSGAPAVSIRNACSNTFTWCLYADAATAIGGITVTIPATGYYYINVSDPSLAGVYTLTVTRQ